MCYRVAYKFKLNVVSNPLFVDVNHPTILVSKFDEKKLKFKL